MNLTLHCLYLSSGLSLRGENSLRLFVCLSGCPGIHWSAALFVLVIPQGLEVFLLPERLKACTDDSVSLVHYILTSIWKILTDPAVRLHLNLKENGLLLFDLSCLCFLFPFVAKLLYLSRRLTFYWRLIYWSLVFFFIFVTKLSLLAGSTSKLEEHKHILPPQLMLRTCSFLQSYMDLCSSLANVPPLHLLRDRRTNQRTRLKTCSLW